MFRSHFIREHPQWFKIFTDGSKTEDGVGCAFTCDQTTSTLRLPPEASIFTAELVSIQKALLFCMDKEDRRVVVCSNSQSSIAAIQHLNSKHPIVKNIQNLMIELKNQQKTLKLCWVPSHTGIQGNERADEGARSAIDSNEIENIALPYKDFYPIIKEKVREKWKDEWRRVQENKLREIKDVVCEWPSSHCRERRAEVTLCRLRIGHTLTTHRHLMERTPPPVCIHCNQPRTVKHLLVECQNNMAQRVQFYGSQTITLRDVLGEGRSFNHRKLMLYLNAIGVRDIWEVWASDYIVLFSCFPWSNTTVDLWYGVPGS